MTPRNPYIGLPPRSLWSRGVTRRFDSSDVGTYESPLLRPDDRVTSIGSCFASNLVPYIESAGLEYIRTEAPPEQVAMLPENLGYRDFSAAYGNVYTTRQMRQLVARATGAFNPAEDRWYEKGLVIDPFRPGLAYPASSDVEFDLITAAHLAATHEALARATVIVLTLGLTEAWESARDGAVFPTCPGTVAGSFDPSQHLFRNFTAREVVDDLEALIDMTRRINTGARFIVTVSPVPLVATATGLHVLEATTYSKAVLRVAATELTQSREGVAYFPAYELVTGPQAPEGFFEDDRRTVTREAVDEVMNALLISSRIASSQRAAEDVASEQRAPLTATEIGRRIAEAECDEALLDTPPDVTDTRDEGNAR